MVNKKEFIELVSDRLSVSKKQAEDYSVAVIDVLESVLQKGGKFKLLNFGTFSVVHRPERKGVNPRNPSQKVTIPAKKVLKFKASSSLVEKIANS